ncbi:MAG: hypothetical protein ACAH59_06250 [Pseudobdellovibrionaceae bacterium]
MKLLLFTMMVLSSWVASADDVRFVTGSGSHSSYCSNSNSYFCVSDIKRRSQDNAINDAAISCQTRYKGHPDELGASCSDICNPNYIPPNSPRPTFVSCRSNCSIRCRISSPTPENEIE